MYRMFSACWCGEQLLKEGDRYSIYQVSREWQREHKAKGHTLIEFEKDATNYIRLYAAAVKGR